MLQLENIITTENENYYIESVFKESKYIFLQNMAKKNGWKQLKDIDFELLQNARGMGEKKIRNIVEKIANTEYLEEYEEVKKAQPLEQMREFYIEELYHENKFNAFRIIANQKGWQKVKDIDFEILKYSQGIGKGKYENILQRVTDINICNEILQEKELKKIEALKRYVKKRTKTIHFDSNSYISINEIENEFKYDQEKIYEYFEKLKSEDKIIWNENGVRYKFETISDVINSIEDERTQYIIKMRFEGKTYQEIGCSLNPQLTKERIRQIIFKNIKNKFIDVEEDKYKEYFEKYDFNEKNFCKMFNEPIHTYMLLIEKYKKGNESIQKLLEDEQIMNNESNIAIDEIFKKVRVFGQFVRLERQEIFEVLVKEFAKEQISIETFQNKCNEYLRNSLKDYNIREYDGRIMEGFAARSKNVIMGNHHKLRYFEYNKLTEEDLKNIEEMLDVNDGFYSSKMFFDSNEKLMQEIDIRDEYELHNLLKSINKNSNIKYLRMPNILIGYETKEDALDELIKELAPIKLEDFLKYLLNNYGHRMDTLYSYITATYKTNMINDTIYSECEEMSEQDLENLNNCIEDRLYTIPEFKNLLVKLNISTKYLNNANIMKLNFKIRDSYILPERYNSVESYLREKILSKKFIKYDNILNKSTYSVFLNKMIREHEIVKISATEYANIKAFEKCGITSETIRELEEQINNTFEEQEFFSIYNLKQKINVEKFEEIGLEDDFYDGLLVAMEGITKLRIANQSLFCKNIQKKLITTKFFIEDFVESYESITLEDMLILIEEKYDLEISYDELKGYLYESKLYYNSILDKVFINKDVYYQELYED